MKKEGSILFLLIVIIFMNFISATTITDDLHLNLQTINSTGSIVAGTYAFAFNISNESDCSNIVYSNLTTLETDSRGILSHYLPNVTLDYDEQYWLCYYRNETLIETTKIARTPYTFRAMNLSGEGIINDSNVDLTNFNVTSDYGLFTFLGSLTNGITSLFVQTINATGSIFSQEKNLSVGFDYSTNGTLINWGEVINGTLLTQAQALNGTLFTQSQALNGTWATWAEALNGTLMTLTQGLNGTLLTQAQALNGTLFTQSQALNGTLLLANNNTLIGNYSSNTDFCISGGTCLSNAGVSWTTIYNGTLAKTDAKNDFGNFNQTMNSTTFFLWSLLNRIGIGTSTPANTLNVEGDINATESIFSQEKNLSVGFDYATNGTLMTLSQALNGTLFTLAQAFNGTLMTLSQALNGTLATWANVMNGTMMVWSEAVNGTLADNATIAAYIDSQDTAFNGSMKTYVDSQDASIDAITLDGFDSSFFTPLNETLVGDYNVTGSLNIDGSWLEGGVTINDGEIFAQTAFFFNITGLNVNTLKINGSILPQITFDDTFDIGNGTLRWNDLHLGGNALLNGTVVADGTILSQGHNLTNAFLYATNGTLINWGEVINGTLLTQEQSLNGTLFTQPQAFNGTLLTQGQALNGTLMTLTQGLNGTLLTQAQALNGTWTTIDQVYNGTLITWEESINGTLLTQVQALNGTLLTQPQAFNGTLLTQPQALNGTWMVTTGDTATGNYTFDSPTFFIDSVSKLIGMGTILPTYVLELHNTSTTGKDVNLSNIVFVNGTSVNVGINTSTPTNTLNVEGDINATTSVFSQEKNLSVGFDYATNGTLMTLTQGLNGTLLTQAQALNGTLFTQPQAFNGTLLTQGQALNGTLMTLTQGLNGTLLTQVQALNGTWATWAQSYNGTLAKTDDANTFGDFNQTFDTSTFFIDAVSGLIGIGTVLQTYVFEVHNTSTTGKDVNLSNVFFVNGTSVNIGINTSTPTNTFNVLGDANITGDLLVGTNITLNQTGITFFDGTLLTTGGIGAGAWEFVSGTAVTNVTFMNFTGLETGYDYSFSIQGAIPLIDAVTLEARFSQSSTWTAGATDYEDGAPDSSISLISSPNTFGNATDEGVSMEVSLPEPNVASRIKRVIATVAGSNIDNNESQKGIAGGRLDADTNAVDGISFFFSSGNWSENGKIYVFRKKLSAGAAVEISSNIWNDSGTNIFPVSLTRKVGIGTIVPQNLFNVLGDANVTGDLLVGTNMTINQTGITFFDGTLQKTAAAGGAWEFVSGTAVTNVTFMNFTGLETGYDYSFSIQGAIPLIDAVTLEARFSQSSTWTAGATDYEDGAPDSSISLISSPNTFGNATDEGVSMEVSLPEPNVASRIKRVIATVAGADVANNESQKGIAGGRLDADTNAVDGISFFFSSGNWTANGKIYVFRKKLSAGPAVEISSNIWNDSGTNIFPVSLTRKVGIGVSSPNYGFEVHNTSSTGEDVNLSDIFFINRTSSNIGIGTSTPVNLLNVLGDINVTGDLLAGTNITLNQTGITFFDGTLQTTAAAGGLTWAEAINGTLANTGTANAFEGKVNITLGSVAQTARGDGDAIVIHDDQDQGISFLSDTALAQSINFGDEEDNDIGRIFYDHNGNVMVFVTGGSTAMTIVESGNVGIGKSPAMKFEITLDNDFMQISDSGNNNNPRVRIGDGSTGGFISIFDVDEAVQISFNGTSGNVNLNGLTASQDVQTDGSKNLVSVSDMNWKTDLGPIENGLEILNQLEPHYFTWKRDATGKNLTDVKQPRLAGFFAQEVYEVFPEGSPGGANIDKYGEEHWGLNSRAIMAVNTKAIQEQQEQIEELKVDVKKLIQENDLMKKSLCNLGASEWC